MKDSGLFLSITGEDIVNIDAMLAAWDSCKLAYVAHAAGGSPVGDAHGSIYRKLLAHPKVYVAPHIAFNSDVERRISSDMMIDNSKVGLTGGPIHGWGESRGARHQ